LECNSNSLIEDVWNKIKDSILEIIHDPYGNYIIQIFLNLKTNPGIVDSIVKSVTKELINLSTQKISSHVVEKCIEVGSNVSFINIPFIYYYYYSFVN